MVSAHNNYDVVCTKLIMGIFRELPVSVVKGIVFSYYSAGFYGPLLPQALWQAILPAFFTSLFVWGILQYGKICSNGVFVTKRCFLMYIFGTFYGTIQKCGVCIGKSTDAVLQRNEREFMKKSYLKRKKTAIRCIRGALTAVVSATVLAPFFTMSSSAAGLHDNVLTDRATHTDLKFEDYEYKRVDAKEFDEIIDGLDELCQDASNGDAVLDVILAMDDFRLEMEKNRGLAEFYSYQYVDDDHYDEEYQFYTELYNDVSDLYYTKFYMIANSACSDVLKDYIHDDHEWQYILDYVPMTQEQKDLKNKDSELTQKYNDLSLNVYQTEINGTKYDEDSLEEAFNNGSVDYSDYLSGLGEIIESKNKDMAELYIEMVEVRDQLAKSYGYSSFNEYAYEKMYYRDYSYDDMDNYRQSVKDYFVPLNREILEMIRNDMMDRYLEMMEAPMTEQECLDNLSAHLPEISNDMMVSYNYMVDHNLCDFAVSDSKAPNGFTTGIQMYNAPLMFNDSDGTVYDMKTMIHEFGHYNQMYYQSAESWKYNKLNLDLAEIHSQGLEMLYMDYYDDIFGDYADVMTALLQYGLVGAAVDGCKEDEFQHRVYENPDGLTVESLNELYYQVCSEYGDADNYNSYYLGMYGVLDDNAIYEWVEIPHTFQSPEYYISYSVSAAAVYELYDDIGNDRDAAIDIYLDLVDREFQDDFQNTVVAAGLNNPIANPRFDLYADDVRASLGLPLQGHKDYSDMDEGGSDDDTVTPAPDDDYDEADIDPDYYDMDGDDDHSADLDPDTIEKNVGIIVAIVFILAAAGVIVLILLIVIIILIVSGSKKKKRAAAAMAQYEQAALNGTPGYVQPMQGGMNGMNGQPMQGSMNGMNGQPENPVQNNTVMPQENVTSESSAVTAQAPVQSEAVKPEETAVNAGQTADPVQSDGTPSVEPQAVQSDESAAENKPEENSSVDGDKKE